MNASQKLQCGDHAETPAVSLSATKEELPVRLRDQAALNVTENIRVEDWFESKVLDQCNHDETRNAMAVKLDTVLAGVTTIVVEKSL